MPHLNEGRGDKYRGLGMGNGQGGERYQGSLAVGLGGLNLESGELRCLDVRAVRDGTLGMEAVFRVYLMISSRVLVEFDINDLAGS